MLRPFAFENPPGCGTLLQHELPHLVPPRRTVFFFLLAVCAMASASAAKPPNIILFFIDDLSRHRSTFYRTLIMDLPKVLLRLVI